MKISELPDYIQSSLSHLLVQDAKKEKEKNGDRYFVLHPKMVQFIKETKNNYAKYDLISQTCDEVSSASLYYYDYEYIVDQDNETTVLKFLIRNVDSPICLEQLIEDYIEAFGIEVFQIAMECTRVCTRYKPSSLELTFRKVRTEE